MRVVALLALVLAFLCGTAIPATAGTPTPMFGLSPEEAVIALRPYKLNAQDAPAGYTAAFSGVTTAVSLSLLDPSPSRIFKAYQSEGFVVSYHQRLHPVGLPSTGSEADGRFVVSLFTGPAKAAAYLTMWPQGDDPALQYEAVTISSVLGDAGAARHVTHAPSGQQAEGYYIVKWQHGQLVFEVFTPPQPLGQEQQSDAENLTDALDAVVQSRPPLSLGAPTVTPPASEAQRLQAADRLWSPLASAGADSARLKASAPHFWDTAQDVGGAADPWAELRLADMSWRFLISESQVLAGQHDGDPAVVATATLCADAEGAATWASRLPAPAAGLSFTAIDPSIQLGDWTFATQGSGPDLQTLNLHWTHGSLAFGVSVGGPPGTTSMDQLAAAAQEVESQYQAQPLPSHTPAAPSVSRMTPPPAMELVRRRESGSMNA